MIQTQNAERFASCIKELNEKLEECHFVNERDGLNNWSSIWN